MGHVIEAAMSGRAKCRGCGQPVARGELRLGERLPNPYAEGELTLWYHLACGAYKRPEVLIEALDAYEGELDRREDLRELTVSGLEHRRLPRVDGAGRSPTGRARCRSCRELIEKESWRIGLVYFDEGRFNPSGYIHVACATEYLGTADFLDRIRHFSPTLTEEDLAEVKRSAQVRPA